MPVTVVDDPGPDSVDVVGLIVGAVASAVSIYLAWRAVKIGKAAADEAEKANIAASKVRAAVVVERRRQFELEILRDLAEWVDNGGLIGIGNPNAGSYGLRLVRRRVSLLRPETLPSWHQLVSSDDHRSARSTAGMDDQIDEAWAAHRRHNETPQKPGEEPAWNEERRRLDSAAQQLESTACKKVEEKLIAELEQAIESHVAANDE